MSVKGEENRSVGVEETVDAAPAEKLAEAVSRRSIKWPISSRVTVSLAALLVVIIVFTFTTSGTLLHSNNITSILTGSAQLGIIAAGVVLLLIAGEYDLSVGQTFAVAIGLFNGSATVYLGLPSFIATLGSFFGLSGIILLVSGGNPVSPANKFAFYNVLDKPLGTSGLKLELLWWLAIAVVAAVVLERTRFGNHIFATGGDRLASSNTGVRTNRVRMILFVVTAVLAGFAGIIQLADIGTMSADAGTNYNLEAIAACVIGGASLFGGVGGVVDSVIGTIFLGLVSTALILSGANPQYYQLFVGIVLVASVALYLRGSVLWDTVVGWRSLRR
jgi:simple sugar transport system permease protein